MDNFLEDIHLCSPSIELRDFSNNNDDNLPPRFSEINQEDSLLQSCDSGVFEAAIKCEQEGCITTLVKEELRLFIELKRHCEGKETIQVNFNEPKRHKLSPMEMNKKEKRKEQNRKAATKCRRKKREVKIKKEEEMLKLKQSNNYLDNEVRKLSQGIAELESILRKHMDYCFELQEEFNNSTQTNYNSIANSVSYDLINNMSRYGDSEQICVLDELPDELFEP